MKKFSCIVLLATILLSSCSSSSMETENNDINAAETEITETTPAETELTDNLPSDLDYNSQTINFMYFTGSGRQKSESDHILVVLQRKESSPVYRGSDCRDTE